MTDEDLENAIRGLPRREPHAGLRESVLSRVPAPQPHRARSPRLAFGLAALVVLLLADWLVLRSQDVGSPFGASPQTVVAQAEPASRDEIALMRELAASGLPLRLAMRHPGPQPETYFDLRNRMLNEADGG
jgi:hypothetical protein